MTRDGFNALAAAVHTSRRCATSGSPLPRARCAVLKNLLVQVQLRHRALELTVLLLQFLQTLGLVRLTSWGYASQED